VNALLQVDETTAKQIELLLFAADAALQGGPTAIDRIANASGAEDVRVVDTEEALRAAAVLLRRAHPTLSRYESHKKILAAFQEACPERGAAFRFTPERVIELPPDTPPCPEPDPRYADLTGIYVPRELIDMPTPDLPDGAIVPALGLLGPLNQLGYDMGGEEDTAGPLLVRYGARCYPALMHALADPDTAVLGRGPNRRLFFKVVNTLPRELVVRVFRAVLEAGWYKPLDHMPKWKERTALAREFRDTPYGPPRMS
jgi:hypothetical protein